VPAPGHLEVGPCQVVATQAQGHWASLHAGSQILPCTTYLLVVVLLVTRHWLVEAALALEQVGIPKAI
jgi:hypothetical protein